MTEKSQRRPNWTEKERLLLVEEVQKREDRIFSKFKGCGAVKGGKLKEAAWTEIATILNSKSDTVQRSVDEVKKQYANIKQRAKEKSDAMRRPPTGGGPKPQSPTVPEQEVLKQLEDRPSLCGLASGHDTEEGASNIVGQDGFDLDLECATNTFSRVEEPVGLSFPEKCGNINATRVYDICVNHMAVGNSSSTIDLPFSTCTTKTTKRRKTMEEEEILTLRAERDKYVQETIKLKQETEFYKTKTLYLELKLEKLKREQLLLQTEN